MARMNENQLRQEIRRRVNEMVRIEGANIDQAKLDSLDIASISAAMAKRWQFVQWDKTSPINGVDAATIIERYGIAPDDAVFMLLKDGQVIVFQPFQPNLSGRQKMTQATINTIAQNMLDTQIDQAIMDEIYPMLVIAPAGDVDPTV